MTERQTTTVMVRSEAAIAHSNPVAKVTAVHGTEGETLQQITTVVVRPEIAIAHSNPVAKVTAIHSAVGLPGKAGTGTGSIVEQVFTGQTSITVDHNRGYRPIVAISNSAGGEIDGAVEHLSLNSFTVFFNIPQSGRVTYF